MTRVCVITESQTRVMNADSMTIHDDTLFIYADDELVGMFKTDVVQAAYKTESKGNTP